MGFGLQDVSLSVEQLRSAMNKLRLSLAEINNGIPSVRGPQHYAKIMQAILDHCCAAKASLTTRISHFCEVTVLRKEVLTSTSITTFVRHGQRPRSPLTHFGVRPQMFSPPLQRDVLIDVFMDHGDVCVEAAVLAEPASPGSSAFSTLTFPLFLIFSFLLPHHPALPSPPSASPSRHCTLYGAHLPSPLLPTHPFSLALRSVTHTAGWLQRIGTTSTRRGEWARSSRTRQGGGARWRLSTDRLEWSRASQRC